MTTGNISKNDLTQTFSTSTALILALSISLA